MIVGAYKTAERELYYDFSDPYTTDPIALFVKTGDGFTYGKWEDLKDKQGVAMSGDSYGQEFDEYIINNNLSMVRVGTAAEAFLMLQNDQADYFIYSYFAGRKVVGESYKGQYEALPTYVAEENFYIAISKKSQLVKYMPQINELIKKYKDDGTIDLMIQEYMQSM
jgi:polar amino acid transport system substrate-binding protein